MRETIFKFIRKGSFQGEDRDDRTGIGTKNVFG